MKKPGRSVRRVGGVADSVDGQARRTGVFVTSQEVMIPMR